MKKQPEYILQKHVCEWLSLQHSEVLFLSDTIASVKLTKQQAVRNKLIQKNGFKTPDLLILEPNQKYNGLFIELKVESPFKKNGELKSNKHLEAQQKSIEELNKKGYYACFSWGFENTIDLIRNYLKNTM